MHIEGEGGRGEGRRKEGEIEKHQGHVFNLKWLLASKCLVDLGNLQKSTSWM